MNQKQLQKDLEDALKIAKHFEQECARWKARCIEQEQLIAELQDLVKMP